MSTAVSWVEGPGARAVTDLGHLLAFRAGTLRRPRVAVMALVMLVLVTVATAVLPQLAPGAGTGPRALAVRDLLGKAWSGFALLAVVSALASGGGRELLARDEAVAYPVDPVTDHLGALVLAPLNLAWLLPAWLLLAGASYGVGSTLGPAQAASVVWLVLATALGQAVGWAVEVVRRGPYGVLIVRLALAGLLLGAAALYLGGQLASVVAALWTGPVIDPLVRGVLGGWTGRAVLTVLALAGAAVAAVLLGAVAAKACARRGVHERSRVETARFAARATPTSDWAALVRVDRASIWRAVPVRRGVALLALAPGAMAFLSDLDWATLTILPGLIASGGVLLYAVNAWCLDARGMLWRENLPVDPGLVFAARAWTLVELLVVVSVLPLVVGGLRAGVPTSAQLTALVVTWVVVGVQVVAASMRWSGMAPHAVDLGSPRAAPAPPMAMLSYSARLAITTTLTSVVFSGLARTDRAGLAVLAALPFLAWSTLRLFRARRGWVDPAVRARIVTAVAA